MLIVSNILYKICFFICWGIATVLDTDLDREEIKRVWNGYADAKKIW